MKVQELKRQDRPSKKIRTHKNGIHYSTQLENVYFTF